MATSGVNVLRYTALGAGLIYGIVHQRTVSQLTERNQIERKKQHQSNLIEKAKAEYEKKIKPQIGNGIITNPDDSRFDLEAYLNMKAAE